VAVTASSGARGFFERLHAFFAPLVTKPHFWVLLFAAVIVVPIGRTLASHMPAPPPVKYQLPRYELTDEHGHKFGSDDLAGKVYVASFIYTYCSGPCPNITKRMQAIQHRSRNLGQTFHLVTLTMDPENDTPERLAEYAKKIPSSPTRWSFLTGADKDVQTLVEKGFKLAGGMSHGTYLVLVDQRGAIRGYYEPNDEGVDAILRDAGILANLGG
jgi:protein SCO1